MIIVDFSYPLLLSMVATVCTCIFKALSVFLTDKVLPIAAFYNSKCGVSVNSLAELVVDKNPRVRARCCAMLAFFVVCLPDRYDHHQRLLPYLLSFYHDDVATTQQMAIGAVDNCGEQYEAEHPEDIIERRQYGVDGDSHCNHMVELPSPFCSRPRLGARLFVRGNTKRFFAALLSELTSWTSRTRLQSASLLKVLIVYCEEHLTMDFHQTLPLIVKALQLAREEQEKDKQSTLAHMLSDVLELIGRYVDPDAYIPLILPRILGDPKSATTYSEGGFHSEASRSAYAVALEAMLRGALAKRLLSHILKLLPALSSGGAIGEYVGTRAKLDTLRALVVLLERIKGKAISGALTAHYQETGRLSNLKEVLSSCRSALSDLICRERRDDIVDLGKRGLQALPKEHLHLK